MRSIFVLLVLLSPATALAKLRVVTTVTDLAAIAGDVGGDLVEVSSLASPSEDPHYVDARPSYVVLLNRADALIIVGLDLEVGWIPRLQLQARNSAIASSGRGFIDASRFVDALEVPVRADRSMGDVHPAGNPHYYFDPRAMAKIALGLAERFAELDATNAEAYRKRGAEVAANLQALARAQTERFAALPDGKRQVVCYHASLPYLLDWLGLRQIGTVEPKPGVTPTPSHVAEVLAAMRANGTRVILQESHHPTSTSAKLAQLAGAQLVVMTGGTDLAAGQRYAQHIGRIAEELHAALSK